MKISSLTTTSPGAVGRTVPYSSAHSSSRADAVRRYVIRCHVRSTAAGPYGGDPMGGRHIRRPTPLRQGASTKPDEAQAAGAKYPIPPDFCRPFGGRGRHRWANGPIFVKSRPKGGRQRAEPDAQRIQVAIVGSISRRSAGMSSPQVTQKRYSSSSIRRISAPRFRSVAIARKSLAHDCEAE